MRKEHERAAFVPVALSIFDDLLPTLTGAQLKVLLVIIRQTVGWGKPSDWITQSYLKERTGLASAAVSGAIAALVRGGLIVVTDANGVGLTSSAQRRRGGRLFFSVSLALAESGSNPSSLSELGYPHSDSQSEHRKAKTTIDTLNKKRISSVNYRTNTDPYSPVKPTSQEAVQPLVVYGPSAGYVAESLKSGQQERYRL